MAENSNIEWTKHTWNPVEGCRKVSPGCKFCYAERLVERYNKKGEPKTKDFSKVRRTSAQTWNFPFKEHRKLTGSEPFTERLVFTCSMSDFFISEADEWREDMWRIIRETPNLIYQILTKRPERIKACLPDDWGYKGYENVWLGTSAENQKTFDLRAPALLSVPAKVRFLSIEPLLEPIWDMSKGLSYWIEKAGEPYDGKSKGARKVQGIDWVIVGGESGYDRAGRKPTYRPCTVGWIKHIVDRCKATMTPVFVKQLGTHLAKELYMSDFKGGKIEQFPEPLRIREWPKGYTGADTDETHKFTNKIFTP